MSISLSRIHAQQSVGAVESRSSAENHGGRKLKKSGEKRKAKRSEIEARTARAEALSSKIERASKKKPGALKRLWHSLTDGGPKKAKREAQADAGRNQADLEKVEQELELLRSEDQDIFAELKRADQALKTNYQSLDELVNAQEQVLRTSVG